MRKIKLKFMVVPDQLAKLAYVPDAVRVRVIDPEAIFLTGLLGESGRKLVKAGVEFYFTRPLAKKLIEKKIAVEVTTPDFQKELNNSLVLHPEFNTTLCNHKYNFLGMGTICKKCGHEKAC